MTEGIWREENSIGHEDLTSVVVDILPCNMSAENNGFGGMETLWNITGECWTFHAAVCSPYLSNSTKHTE